MVILKDSLTNGKSKTQFLSTKNYFKHKICRCYVGPTRTQWRKCSDRYYPYGPYGPPTIDRHDHTIPPTSPYPPPVSQTTDPSWSSIRPPLPGTETTLQPPNRTSFRPDRPPAVPTTPAPKPTLDQYEQQFHSQFLEPPRPGGFGQPRHWPVSYLHKEGPYNESGDMFEMRMASLRSEDDSQSKAIHNVIQIIKSNDVDGLLVTPKSNDTFRLSIPLANSSSSISTTIAPLQVVDLQINDDSVLANRDRRISGNSTKPYRRGLVTRTSVKNYGRKWANANRDRTDYRIIV